MNGHISGTCPGSNGQGAPAAVAIAEPCMASCTARYEVSVATGHHRHTQVGEGEVGGGLAHAPFRIGDGDVHVGQVPNHGSDSTCNRLGCLLHGSDVCHDQSHSFSRLPLKK